MRRIKKILFLAFMIFVLGSNVLNVQASSFKFDLTVEEEEVEIGDTVKIDLQISDIDAKEGINVVEADLEYDETIFESVAFEDLNDWTSIYNIEEGTKKGKFIMMKAVEGVTKQEKIGRIQFKLKDNLEEMETEIKINNITSNDGIELMDEGTRTLKVKIVNKKDDGQTGQQNVVQTIYEQNNSENTNNEKNEKADSIIPKTGDNIKTGDRIVLIVVAVILLISINLIYFIVKVKQLKGDNGIEKQKTRMITLSIISFLLIIIVLFLAKDVFAFEEKNIEEMIQSLKNENENNPESEEYLITDETISRIKPETTIQMLESNLQNIKVLDHTGAENLKTGMILEYEENKRTYEISVLGDINGDGIANQIELTREIRECLKCENWRIEKKVEKLSADINCDKKIDQEDVSSLINYIVYGKLEVKEVEPVIKPKIEVLSGEEVEEGKYISSVTVKITQENEDTKTEKTMYKITGSKTTEEKEIDNKEEVIELTETGVYKITSYTYGIDGNKSKTSDLIIVIEKLPEIKITPETWTKDHVIATIEMPDEYKEEGYHIEYVLSQEEKPEELEGWITYPNEGIIIEENTTIYARLAKEEIKGK